MKKILSITVLALLVGYITFAAIALCRRPEGKVCEGIRLEIKDSLETGYVTTRDIISLLSRNDLDPTGKPLSEVSLRAMEEMLATLPIIASCECYETLSGHVAVEVRCRKPILRVMSERNDDYYIDGEGEVIEHITKAAYVPVATGHITREYARKELLPLAKYLQEEELWNAQIEQIHVGRDGDIELIPRVGNHVIELGRPTDYADKLGNLEAFYKKALSEVGWDRYSRINIDHTGQVVATKRQP